MKKAKKDDAPVEKPKPNEIAAEEKPKEPEAKKPIRKFWP